MLPKYFAFIIVAVLLIGSTAERNEIITDLENSQSAPVTSSEIAVPISESYGTVEVIGGDEQTLRAFIQRWFTPMYAVPSSTSQDDNTTVTIGALPEDLPFEFPLPEKGVVFASVKSPYDLQIMLDSPGDEQDLMAAYTQKLEKAGWILKPTEQGSGFVSSIDNWQSFCDDQSQVALVLQSYPKSGQGTEIRITLYDKDVQYMCDPQSVGGQDPAASMLPVLEAPTGARITSGGSSSGNGTADSSSDIRTDLTPSELNTHFSGSLEAANWDRLESGDAGNFSWSSWETKDEQGDLWSGTLIILKNPVEDDLVYAMMRVVKSSK